ncbi:Heavy metal transport/detoxification protein [Paenibacillus curdlanolyticus YK9]|uniref:Heavy metal transport/detoxification protein n=1 Tax=Paenibacillus curdlanolyticus YK9 TaxID=717606 RepID=E0IG77_9BACL|nr:cation transporter [Paenibacillus curdlanolyticus]EFM08479.1 Heavy metal transport/detoxification protein [Paenibacillus curdlanolyticus YK9]
MKQVTLNVEGMSCGHCINSIEGALQEAGAVGKVDLTEGQVHVSFDETKLELQSLIAVIEEEGYNVR